MIVEVQREEQNEIVLYKQESDLIILNVTHDLTGLLGVAIKQLQ